MASYNRIVLLGNLTRDPQLSYTPNNVAICKFGLATNRTFKDRDGNSREETCFIDCALFGKGGEVFNQYMSKGRMILLEGRLQFHQWTTPEGDKRSKHEVVVESFTFLGGRAPDGAPNAADTTARGAPVGGARGPGYDEPPPPTDSEIPF